MNGPRIPTPGTNQASQAQTGTDGDVRARYPINRKSSKLNECSLPSSLQSEVTTRPSRNSMNICGNPLSHPMRRVDSRIGRRHGGDDGCRRWRASWSQLLFVLYLLKFRMARKTCPVDVGQGRQRQIKPWVLSQHTLTSSGQPWSRQVPNTGFRVTAQGRAGDYDEKNAHQRRPRRITRGRRQQWTTTTP